MADAGSSRRPRRPDGAALAVSAALAALSLLIFWSTYSMGGAASYARVGPTAFPYAVAAALAAIAGFSAVKAWKGEFPEREADETAPVLWIVGGLAAQMLLLKTAGFSIATGLLFAATARGFGRGPLWLTIPIGIVLSFAIYAVFARLLQLSLPAGPLETLFF